MLNNLSCSTLSNAFLKSKAIISYGRFRYQLLGCNMIVSLLQWSDHQQTHSENLSMDCSRTYVLTTIL